MAILGYLNDISVHYDLGVSEITYSEDERERTGKPNNLKLFERKKTKGQ